MPVDAPEALAKVGVVGSNPIARSRFSQADHLKDSRLRRGDGLKAVADQAANIEWRSAGPAPAAAKSMTALMGR